MTGDEAGTLATSIEGIGEMCFYIARNWRARFLADSAAQVRLGLQLGDLAMTEADKLSECAHKLMNIEKEMANA